MFNTNSGDFSSTAVDGVGDVIRFKQKPPEGTGDAASEGVGEEGGGGGAAMIWSGGASSRDAIGDAFLDPRRVLFWLPVGGRDSPLPRGQNQVVLGHRVIHFPTSSGVSERASEQMIAAERAGKENRAEQANE